MRNQLYVKSQVPPSLDQEIKCMEKINCEVRIEVA